MYSKNKNKKEVLACKKFTSRGEGLVNNNDL
jgi:hypothetical protein